ncbi:uncharacterized protein Ecym_1216 [Eremothecium cymbalariae DBVPG|uniref:Uncharacterized protein n=1 Tax=Eremothecium cymbalariae (strain CBS 270.75 / DBVPG 7215 / KCTC 17166 / NRRL Y-17582) TaxID=931890 RepID=G8JMZ9_ERECY|nr:hypothetical protein Ecym_1216 [Eremothecium cymbalariae DBVPG\
MTFTGYLAERCERPGNDIYSSEERYLLSITEQALSCSEFDEIIVGSDTMFTSTSTMITSESSTFTKASQCNLWTKEMEMSYGQALEKMAVLEPVQPDNCILNSSDIIRVNDAISNYCRAQKVKQGLPPFMFITASSKVNNMIDATFLFTDDHEQFHYMQRYNNFPNSNSLEYVRMMIQPYIEFMDDMATGMEQRKHSRYRVQESPEILLNIQALHNASRQENNSITRNQEKEQSESVVSSTKYLKKCVRLWNSVKKAARHLNSRAVLVRKL